jgi:hypothetical protein
LKVIRGTKLGNPISSTWPTSRLDAPADVIRRSSQDLVRAA